MSYFTRISSSASTSAETTTESESTTTTTTLTSNHRARNRNKNSNHTSDSNIHSFVILATNRDDDVVEEIDSQRGRSCDTDSSNSSGFEDFVGDADHSLIYRSAAFEEPSNRTFIGGAGQQQQKKDDRQQKNADDNGNNHKDPSAVRSSPRLDFVIVAEEDNGTDDDKVAEGNDALTTTSRQEEQHERALNHPEKNENPKNGNDDDDDETAAVARSQKTTNSKPLQDIEIEDPYKTGKWTIERLRELNRATFNKNNNNNNIGIETFVPFAICQYHLAKENIEVVRPFGKSTLLCRQWEKNNNNNINNIENGKNDQDQDKKQNHAVVITRGQDTTKCTLTFFHFFLPSDEEHAISYITQVRQIPRCPSIVTGVAARKRTDGVFEIETEFMDGGSLDRFICGCCCSSKSERLAGDNDDDDDVEKNLVENNNNNNNNNDSSALSSSSALRYNLSDAHRATLAKSVARQILLGLCFTHVVLGKSHRSLSTKTILFRRDGRAKIQSYDTLTKSEISARFDNEKSDSCSNYASEFLCSAFLAPELASSPNSKSFEIASTFSPEGKSDVWSLGICLICIALNIPFKDMIVERKEKEEQNENIRLVEKLIAANENVTSEGDDLWRTHVSPNDIALRFLIRRCLEVDPRKRISVVEAFALTFIFGRTDTYQNYQEKLSLRGKSNKNENQQDGEVASPYFDFARDPFVTPVTALTTHPSLARFPFIGQEIKKIINLDEEGNFFIPHQSMMCAIPNEMRCLLPRTNSSISSAPAAPSAGVFTFCGAHHLLLPTRVGTKKINPVVPQVFLLQQQQPQQTSTSTGFHYLDVVVHQLNQEFINHRVIRHSADEEAKENLRIKKKKIQIQHSLELEKQNQNQKRGGDQNQNGAKPNQQASSSRMLRLSTKADEESSVLGRELREIWKARLAPATFACEKILSDFRAKKQK